MGSHHPHSEAARGELAAEGTLSRRKAQILRWMQANPQPWTDRQIAARLGYPDMNCVRPRITELIEQGLLVECDSIRCQVTNKRVRRTAPALAQGELPL